MEQLLQQQAEHKADAADFLAKLLAQIRPAKPDNTEQAVHAIRALCHLLHKQPAYASALRDALLSLFSERKPVSLYVDSGIHPSSGFFSELWRRFSHKLLPDALDLLYLKDVFSLIFPKPSDERWVLAVPDEVWLELLWALRFETSQGELTTICQQSLLDGLQVLSYRLSALGLEPELIRNHPELEDHSSPFIIQNVELLAFLQAPAAGDAKHLLVMLDQCQQVIGKIRRNSAQTGTSIRLTFLLQRMTQQIQRMETLLSIIVDMHAGEDVKTRFIQFFKTLVYAECHKNDMRQHWRENMELVALRVTENASRTGEHYITEDRSEYFALMKSAMGAGAIVGVMAMLKIIIATKHYAPLTEAIFFSLNYGLGFVLIHMLHFTVATKQPAMTAAAIASSIDASDGKSRNMDKLVTIIAQTMRSQTIAIIGNVVIAIPVAMLIAASFYYLAGSHFVSPEKAQRLMADIDPLRSAALIYAAIAGVCLFLAGLIAGYHDNLAIYNKIPQRLRALGWLQTLLGPDRLRRFADYVENNLGALAGNFYFGCLLGGMAAIGVLLGLPIDIRHITFSSAFLGFSLVGLDFNITWQVVAMAALGVWLIGTVNLLVSFSLALYVAMKSRKLSFAQWRMLIGAVFSRLWHQPRDFFLPPRKELLAETEA